MGYTRTYKCTLNYYLVFLAILFSFCVIIFALFHTETPRVGSSTQSSGLRASDTLRFVSVISRHGNRRSLVRLPFETVHWNYGIGELTLSGHIQAHDLGVKIRSLYNGFLSTEYRSVDISASSTSKDRTMMSGELFLAGLYPPVGYQVWNPHIRWQPIPLYSNSSDMSSSVEESCPRYLEERVEAVRVFDKENADNISSINSYLSEHLGFNVTGSLELYDIWDAFFCLEAEGIQLPDWTRSVYPEPMMAMVKKSQIPKFSGTPTMTRLLVGTLFKEITSVMKMKITGSLSPDRKMYYNSGHDMTIIGLQCVLGVPKESIGVIMPSSALIFELHENPAGSFYVEVLYLDGSAPSTSLRAIIPPECGNPCDFDTLVKATQQYTNFSNYEQECKSKAATQPLTALEQNFNYRMLF